jgi:hypothetical protein
VVTLDGFQVYKTADCQPLLVVLPAIDRSVNMLGEDLSCLHEDRVVLLPHLPIDGKRSLDRGRRDDFFNFNRIHGPPPDANAPARRLGPISQLVNSELVPRPDIRFRIVSRIENSGGEMDVVGSSRMSRAALARRSDGPRSRSAELGPLAGHSGRGRQLKAI